MTNEEQAVNILKKEIKEESKVELEKIGNYLITRMNDEKLSSKIIELSDSGKSKVLPKMWKFIISQAKEYLNSKDGVVMDETVYGWCIHYLTDGANIIKSSKTKKKEVVEDDDEDQDDDSKPMEKAEKTSKRGRKPKQIEEDETPFLF